jgi:hypothetical protein
MFSIVTKPDCSGWCCPDKTLGVSGDDVYGTKQSKDRLTVLFTVSRTGERFKPLVIGKSNNPRCLKNISKKYLPVHYKFNKKSWMTREIFREYPEELYLQMRKQKRYVLLLLIMRLHIALSNRPM